jgi:hypothetical protein
VVAVGAEYELRLTIDPLVLGRGKRLFGADDGFGRRGSST